MSSASKHKVEIKHICWQLSIASLNNADGATVFYPCQKLLMACSVWLSLALLVPSLQNSERCLRKKSQAPYPHSWLTKKKKKKKKAHDAGHIIKNI